jgi:hypothetical protein
MNVRLLESDRGKKNFRIRIAKKIGWFRPLGLCRVWESERALHTAIETHTESGIIREGMFKFQNYNGINNLSGPGSDRVELRLSRGFPVSHPPGQPLKAGV